MKRIFFILGAIALSLGATAQLRVFSNGHVQLGDWKAELQQVGSNANKEVV